MIFKKLVIIFLGLIIGSSLLFSPAFAQLENPQQGSVGIEGTIPTDPPTSGATISFPTNGQVFRDIPITVTGICPADLLVKMFKNDVFAGSVMCDASGNFSIEVDLFSGNNQLIARVFDNLDQPGPDSNTVNVEYLDNTAEEGEEQLIVTSNFASRGSDPGTALTWTLAVSGGVNPYAASVDWGDGEVEPLSVPLAGNFTISHIYREPGTYNIIVKVTDERGKSAFIQLVGVANGTLTIAATGEDPDGVLGNVIYQDRYVLWPMYVMIFLLVSTFWLGKRYEKKQLRKKLEAGERVF